LAVSPAWVAALRLKLRPSLPTGLTVKGQASNGRVVVCWNPPGASKGQAITLPGLTWAPSQATAIREAVLAIAAELEAGRPLAAPAPVATNRVTGGPLWAPLLEAFAQHKLTAGHVSERTLERMYQPSLQLIARHGPLSATPTALIRRCATGEPGTRGRQQRVQHLCQVMRWGVAEGLLPAEWSPPEDLEDLIGRRLTSPAPAHPILDAEALELVEGLPDPRWRFAVQLLATFGLRPVELRHLRGQADGSVACGYSKRTSRGSTQPRTVQPLPPEGAGGDWLNLAARLINGEPLPPLGDARGAAESVSQYLSRREAWRALKASAAADGRRLAGYSFRHGFALRAHQLYALSPRVAAALMGHSLETHARHYGAWTDEATVAAAVAAGYRRAAGGAAN
jgi:integrase